MGAMICDFGKKSDGYNLFHIHGTKEQCEKAVQMIKDTGVEIREPYELSRAAPHINCMYSDWMAVVNVWLPEISQEEEVTTE
jgi:hypothetical protein